MLRGLTTLPKPFLRRVMLENAQQPKTNQGGFVDLYTVKTQESTDEVPTKSKISITLDFCTKIKYPNNLWASLEQKSIDFLNFEKDLKTILSNVNIIIRRFTDKQTFLSFLASPEEAQRETLKVNSLPQQGKETHRSRVIWNGSLSDYTYYDDGVPSIPYISIPTQTTIDYEFDVQSSNENPEFLAYAYFLHSGYPDPGTPFSQILSNTISSEVIFDGGATPTQTGFFTIGNTFGYKGQELSLFETEVFTDVQDKDPITGYPMGTTKPTGLVAQVNQLYGIPGDIWVGPLHMHKVVNPEDPNFGKYRAMAGNIHEPNTPHPFLDYNLKSNDKIIDFRSISKLEELFVYNTDIYEKLLASTSEVIYTGTKKKNTIDDLVSKIAIVSEAEYAIRKTTRVITGADPNNRGDDVITEKDNVHFIFAIDKMRLLKDTTKLPGLLDKLTFANPIFADEFVNRLDIFHFEIIRINKTTGESKSLIVGNNDRLFNDFNSVNRFGVNNSKGFSLTNNTIQVKIENKKNINFYEFTDGELDNSGYDEYDYTYKIILKYRDPLVEYLTERLEQARQVIRDLDELGQKTEFKIYDTSKNKFVDVFDRYQSQLNSQFVSESLNLLPHDTPPLPQIPFTPEFSGFNDKEIPNSVEDAFPTADLENLESLSVLENLESLSVLLISLNIYDDLEPVDNFVGTLGSVQNLIKTINYIKNSLILSSTTPTLIQKVRSLVYLLEVRLTNSLELYTTEDVTKKDTGFTTKDYIQSTNVKNAGSFVTEFDHTFNSINLSETKNYFDWIASPANRGTESGLKTITVQDYINLVTINRDTILSAKGKQEIGSDANFSYSFIPVMGALLNLFNSNAFSNQTKYFQTIRKRLFDRITDKTDPIVVPEILSFFGIKFTTDNVENVTTDQLSTFIKALSYEWGDNWGAPFDPSNPPPSAEDFVEVFAAAFGSVQDPQYEWQGGSLSDYPLLIALSLVNILNTDNQFKDKDIRYLNEVYNSVFDITDESFNVFTNKEVPFEINLFSTVDVATSPQNNFEASYVTAERLNSLFTKDGNLKYYNYAWYIMLLGLFGKVSYLKGFNQGQESTKLTPTSYYDRNLIKSLNWVPVAKQDLDNLSEGEQLLCKVELFEGGDFASLLDQRIINQFKDYFNYNNYFLITGGDARSLISSPFDIKNKIPGEVFATQGIISDDAVSAPVIPVVDASVLPLGTLEVEGRILVLPEDIQRRERRSE